MITYPISSNLCKKFICNVIGFPIFHFSEAATRGVLLEKVFLEILQNSQENNCVSFFSKIAGLGNCFWSFLCILLKICLFHFNRKMRWSKGNTLMEFKYFFAWVAICLTSKISKEIWQMVIWSENVFKENLMLQFPWLEEFH